jgi:hypothetical protein
VEIQSALVADIPPPERVAFLCLMVPASNHEDRVALLGGLKAQLPPPAFAGLVAALRPALPEPELERVVAAI